MPDVSSGGSVSRLSLARTAQLTIALLPGDLRPRHARPRCCKNGHAHRTRLAHFGTEALATQEWATHSPSEKISSNARSVSKPMLPARL